MDGAGSRDSLALRAEEIDMWVFDLDHTLYPPGAGLLTRIDVRMTEFIAAALEIGQEAASKLRTEYWEKFGATLEGLTREHEVEREAFLDYVHDISLDGVVPNPRLKNAIAALRGRKIVHTNGSRAHAGRVLDALKLADAFERVFALEDVDFKPKPSVAAYDRVRSEAGFDPLRAAMFEDTAANLAEPKNKGMWTLWVAHPCQPAAQAATPAHVDVRIDDLTEFLERLTPAEATERGAR